MPHSLGLILRILIGACGLFFVYASLSYEDEDKTIQNLLENWWIRIDDLRHQSISAHIAFMKVLSAVLTRTFDRVFGARIISFQSLGVSLCYSFVCFDITVLIILHFFPQPNTPPLSSTFWQAVFWTFYGTIPALIPQNAPHLRWLPWIQIWFWLFIIYCAWSIVDPWAYIIFIGLSHLSEFSPEVRTGGFFLLLLFLSIIVCLILAMLLFASFIGIMRATLRAIARSQSPIKIILLSGLNASPILTLYVMIKVLEESLFYEGFGIWLFIFTLILLVLALEFNLAFVLSGVLFVCLAITMLLHRLFYPFVQRPLYYFQALGVAKRPLRFRLIGVTLFGAAFGKIEWLSSLLDKI